MKKFKRFLRSLIALTLVLSSLLLTSCFDRGGGGGDDDEDPEKAAARTEFIDTLGGVSETFKGSVSEEEYDTAEKAAKAYVAEEVAGAGDVSVLSTKSNGELSAGEVNKLIPAELKEGVVSVEEIEVEYSQDDTMLLDTLNKNKTVKVYIIKYENCYKYFTPAPVTGETISKSYYDSVFNAEKYLNCTFKSETYMDMDMAYSTSGSSMTQKTTMTVSQTIKFAGNKIYLEVITTETGGLYGDSEGESTDAIYAYIEKTSDDILCYIKIGETETEWVVGDLYEIGFSELEELTPFYDEYLDYTYFTKTEYGFKVDDENAKQFVSELLGDLMMDDIYDGVQMNMDMFAEYYVSEGVLSGARSDVDLDMSVNEGGISMTMKIAATATTSCTNYGTTVVEKPFTE